MAWYSRRMLAKAIEVQLRPQAWLLPVAHREPEPPDEPSPGDPSWFSSVMVPYIRQRVPDPLISKLISRWQDGDPEAVELVNKLAHERELRRRAARRED